jgi:hypothetical protein
MRKLGLVVVLALVGFACADGVGQMLTDAGQMIEDAGTSMQDGSVPDAGAQDETVTCDKSETWPRGDGNDWVLMPLWAEFEVDPGVTEVTVCRDGDPNAPVPPDRPDFCSRTKADWHHGTSTGFVYCGRRRVYDDPETPDVYQGDVISITAHR